MIAARARRGLPPISVAQQQCRRAQQLGDAAHRTVTRHDRVDPQTGDQIDGVAPVRQRTGPHDRRPTDEAEVADEHHTSRRHVHDHVARGVRRSRLDELHRGSRDVQSQRPVEGPGRRCGPRPGEVVAAARRAGLAVELLTGDSSAQGPLLASELGIEQVETGLQPDQKMTRVQALQAAGSVVTMVGDGLNDAPVLSLADASFAVAGATDLARTQADFVIVGEDLHSVTSTWRKARQCRRIILENFSWALGYNICAIPLAALGYVPPWAAAIGMSLSSLLVVANSLRLNSKPRSQGLLTLSE